LQVARLDGSRLAEARLSARLTQAAVAERLGLSSAVRVSLWERGAEQPRARFIPLLAEMLDTDPLDLLVGEPSAPTISALRLAAGLSREDVWTQAQISKMTYHRIDRGVGVRRPDPTIIRSLARVLEQDEADTLAAVT
jgi:transcriptional regulator with XRE-family HTH domain